MTFLDQGDSKGPIWNNKTNLLKIYNIHCERGFLYILGNPGPLCGAPDSTLGIRLGRHLVCKVWNKVCKEVCVEEDRTCSIEVTLMFV